MKTNVSKEYVAEFMELLGGETDLPIYYHIYSARIETYNGNFAELSYVATEFIGSIEVVNGTPTFKPYNKEA